MQIKERGNKLQLLRPSYNKDRKRTVQTAIGTVRKYNRTTPDEMDTLGLTAEEREQLSAYYDQQEASWAKYSHKNAIAEGASKILAIADALGKTETVSEQTALDILAATEILKKALHRHGVKKKMLTVKKGEEAEAGNNG